ncbi:unnamed protein product [Ectocarpus sp. 4 AP-2014]
MMLMLKARGSICCRSAAAAARTTPPLERAAIPISSTMRRLSTSTHSRRTTSPEQHKEWKSVYRAFLLHVHPDFFHESPKQRAVNEKSLKSLSQHLDRLQLGGENTRSGGVHNRSNTANGSTSPLVFFLKQAGEEGAGSKSDGSPSCGKVMLPLGSHHQMATHLYDSGMSGVNPPPAHAERASTRRHHISRPADTSNNDNHSRWHGWEDELFGGTAANRAWDEAAAGRNGSGHTHGRSAFSSDDDKTREGRQRTTEWGAAFERRSGHVSRLGQILSTDEGRALVRERRSSSRKVRRLVGELREQYGFGEFIFRCGWSKSNLCVALGSLLETCRARRGEFLVNDFGGLEVVFRNDPSVLHEGEIRLCPADVPNQWVSALRRVTPAVLSAAEERSREMISLQERASRALRGARLSRGLSCSKSRFRDFLSKVCAAADAEPDEGGGGGGDAATDLVKGDWSDLRCKVEEGFRRVSTVLEDGTIQVGSDMTLKTLRRCLGKDSDSSSAATAEYLKLAVAEAATAERCRQSLGLESIKRSHHAVGNSEMVMACEALVRFSERAKSGGDLRAEKEAVAARRRLRGHCVRVVGSRVGVCDGVTEDGEIVLPWNWWEEEDGEERRSSAPVW